MHRCASERQPSLGQPSAAEQLCVGPTEIPVEGWIQDGVESRVKVAQPQHHRVECIRGVCLFLYAHAGEEGEVREPANDKGTQHCCQGDGGFVLSCNGRGRV